ncbi:MAG: outer membrane protein assembly factor BamA [Treponema sp.]|nr:outer membrane protein assembly factor BamA [Treponema sp.]
MFSFHKFYGLIALVLAFFVLSFPLAAQEEETDWYMGKTISQIDFEGLRSVKKSELSGLMNSFIGRAFTDDVYNDILDRLYALGYFEDIEPYAKHDARNASRVILVFTVKEHAVISSLEFRGNKKIRNNELKDAVSSKVGDIFIEQTVLMDERAIHDLYIKKGYANARISHTYTDNGEGIKLVFNIVEGSGTVITEITFTGNTVFSDRTLKGKISLKEEGFMRDGAFQRASVDTDKQAILAHYATKGYVDARIIDVLQENSINETKAREEVRLTFVLQEGDQYTYSGLTITGNEIFSTDRLMSFVKLKNGDIFNQTKFQEGLAALTNLYYENGYMSNEFYPNVLKDPERHTIGYSLSIVERSRAHVENIIIKGNTKTQEQVILRELPIKPGDVFSRDKIMSGMRNLYNTQYFSSVVPEPVSGSEENLVDLIITVEEQSTTSLQLGMTFSGIEDPDDFPLSLFFKWQNSNLKGLGKTISAGLSLAAKDQSIDFSYSQNWIGNQPIQFSESVSLFHSNSSMLLANWLASGVLDDDYYYSNYTAWGASLGTSFGRRWLPPFAILTVAGGMTNSLTDNIYNEEIYLPIDAGISKYVNRFGLKNSLYGSISLDNRDINYDPSKGWFVSDRIAWYGLIPGLEHEFYLRNDLKLEAYYQLFDIPIAGGFWNFRMVLAAYTGLTTINPVPGTPFGSSSKVYIDGMFNGRGWTDIYNEVRGKMMFSNRVELRIPVFTGVIGIDGFFDAVAVGNEPKDLFSLKKEDFFFSFGPGIRFLVPQFPLHLLFAWKFKCEDGDWKWAGDLNHYDTKTWEFVLSFNITNR